MQPDTPEVAKAKAEAQSEAQPDIAIGEKELEILRKRVQDGLTVTAFVEGEMGQLMVRWLNSEIARLTAELMKEEYDDKPMKTVAIRAELRAHTTIANRLSATQAKASMAKRLLKDGGIEVPGEDDDLRSPQEIQADAAS
jgi:hypothetical protein